MRRCLPPPPPPLSPSPSVETDTPRTPDRIRKMGRHAFFKNIPYISATVSSMCDHQQVGRVICSVLVTALAPVAPFTGAARRAPPNRGTCAVTCPSSPFPPIHPQTRCSASTSSMAWCTSSATASTWSRPRAARPRACCRRLRARGARGCSGSWSAAPRGAGWAGAADACMHRPSNNTSCAASCLPCVDTCGVYAP